MVYFSFCCSSFSGPQTNLDIVSSHQLCKKTRSVLVTLTLFLCFNVASMQADRSLKSIIFTKCMARQEGLISASDILLLGCSMFFIVYFWLFCSVNFPHSCYILTRL